MKKYYAILKKDGSVDYEMADEPKRVKFEAVYIGETVERKPLTEEQHKVKGLKKKDFEKLPKELTEHKDDPSELREIDHGNHH